MAGGPAWAAGCRFAEALAERDQHPLRRPISCTLPTDTAAFAGRGEQVSQIAAAAVAAAEAGRVVAIHAINGMPGVGKTTLAVHVGHMIASKFPDRQLFVDLHAHTPGRRPVEPADALAVLLTADGVAPWRDRLAGKRVLLILDNAATSDQVTPLAVGAAGCLVLVMSRRYLGDLSTALVSVPLDILPADDALTMFDNLAPRARAEPGKAAHPVGLCGYLPPAPSRARCPPLRECAPGCLGSGSASYRPTRRRPPGRYLP